MDKMTKKVAFGLALDALKAVDTDEARTAMDVVEKEIERLSRVSAKAHSGETKADKEKAAFRQSVLEVLADAGTAMRATEVAKGLDVSCQKASAALKVLVESGAVVKSEGEKRVTLFAVVTADVDGEEVEG